MKVKVSYKQKEHLDGIYSFYRIVTFKEKHRFFRTKIKIHLFNSLGMTLPKYISRVKTTLKFDEHSIIDLIRPDLENCLADPSLLRNDIRKYEREIELWKE